jgi:hypothetical protein
VQCSEAPDELPGDIDDKLEVVPTGTRAFEELDFGGVHEVIDAIRFSGTAYNA